MLLAWALLLITAVLWQVSAPVMYEQYAVATGQELFSPGFLDRYSTSMPKIAAFNILFYTSLWLVKISFLIIILFVFVLFG